MAKQAIPGASRTNLFLVDPTTVVIIGLDTEDGRDHPLWDPRIEMEVPEGLVLNIMKYGVLEPPLVRKNGDRIEVIDGRQRIRAARTANERLAEAGGAPLLVPVMLRKADDLGHVGVMVTANEQRFGDDAVAKAMKAQRLLDFGGTVEDVGIAMGVSVTQVKNLLTILDLSSKVQKAISGDKVSYSAAIQLADLTHTDQNTKLAAMLENGATGYADAKRQKKERQAGKAPSNGEETSLRGKGVKVAVLRKVADDEDFMGNLSEDARHLLLWILGDQGRARKIKGLSKLLKD